MEMKKAAKKVPMVVMYDFNGEFRASYMIARMTIRDRVKFLHKCFDALSSKLDKYQ